MRQHDPSAIDVAGIQPQFAASANPPKPEPKFSIPSDRPTTSGLMLKTKLGGCHKAPTELQIDISLEHGAD